MWTRRCGGVGEIGLGVGVGAGVGYAGSILDLDVVEKPAGNATTFFEVKVDIVGRWQDAEGRRLRGKERKGGDYGQAFVLSRKRMNSIVPKGPKNWFRKKGWQNAEENEEHSEKVYYSDGGF